MGASASVSTVLADHEHAVGPVKSRLPAGRKKRLIETVPDDFAAEFKETFAMFDKSKSGSVLANELGPMLRHMGDNPTDFELRDLLMDIGVTDAKTQSFDEEEFLAMMAMKLSDNTTSEELLYAFKCFDADGSGYIDAIELQGALEQLGGEDQHAKYTGTEISDLIKAADMNKDGRIDYEEFCKFIKDTKAAVSAMVARGELGPGGHEGPGAVKVRPVVQSPSSPKEAKDLVIPVQPAAEGDAAPTLPEVS